MYIFCWSVMVIELRICCRCRERNHGEILSKHNSYSLFEMILAVSGWLQVCFELNVASLAVWNWTSTQVYTKCEQTTVDRPKSMSTKWISRRYIPSRDWSHVTNLTYIRYIHQHTIVPGTATVRRRRLLLRFQTVKTVKIPAPNC